MALYCYIKKEAKRPPVKRLSKISLPRVSIKFSIPLSLMFIATGIGILLLVIWPIVSWQLLYPTIAPERKLAKPLPQINNSSSKEGVARAFDNEENTDFTRASNWFPLLPQQQKGEKIEKYTISIPKLGITEATVIVGSEDLTKSLIHYGGTALPGEYGNAVIFGHSVLPEFYDPKNYTTIFATLPTLEIGDEVFAAVDNINYKYVVYELKTVDPTDISVLEQRYDNYYISLITCVPPGLKWKRLVVKAKLEPLEE